MNKEKIVVLLGGPYGVRVVHAIKDDCGEYRIVEPNPPVYYNVMYSDDPPVDAIAYCNGCGQELTGDYGDVGWIPMDEEDEL